MKGFIEKISTKIIEEKGEISYQEALALVNYDFQEDKESLEYLFEKADEIRKKFNGNKFDLCTIVNAKSGNCSEDCKYCAQSSHYNTGSPIYDLMDSREIIAVAKDVENGKVDKFSLVTSGRGLDDEKELERLKNIYKNLKEETTLALCASHGIISFETAKSLKAVGVETYHHNLESSDKFYSEICTTHTYQDRIDTCKNARKAGMRVCSGGILGLGETREDRIKMAFELKKLEVDSIPINILTIIPGTPLALENIEPLKPLEILKTIAIYKFINPKASIRYAGGRQLLGEYERVGIRAGVSAALTGNYLTTTGSTIEKDREMVREADFELRQ